MSKLKLVHGGQELELSYFFGCFIRLKSYIVVD